MKMKNTKNIWSEITLDEYVQIREMLEDKNRDTEDVMISLAALLQGVDEETILTMPLDQVAPVFEMVHGLSEKPRPNIIRKHYRVGKWELETIGREMCVAQWIDFQNYARDGFDRHLADILSVVLLPKGKRYNTGYDIEELKKDLGGMPIGDALAVCFFFQRRYLRSMKHILTFLVGWTTLKKGMKGLRREARRLRKEISALLASR